MLRSSPPREGGRINSQIHAQVNEWHIFGVFLVRVCVCVLTQNRRIARPLVKLSKSYPLKRRLMFSSAETARRKERKRESGSGINAYILCACGSANGARAKLLIRPAWSTISSTHTHTPTHVCYVLCAVGWTLQCCSRRVFDRYTIAAVWGLYSFVEFARARVRVERQYKIKTNSACAHACSRIKKIYSIVKRYVVFI